MKIGEVSLLTNDVRRLATFYRELLEIENDSEDETHQFLITEETTLTVYNDGSIKNNQNQNICLAFTVDDIEKEYKKVLSMGAKIIEAPTKRPWGAINMRFYDPDNNMIFFRSFPKNRMTIASFCACFYACKKQNVSQDLFFIVSLSISDFIIKFAF